MRNDGALGFCQIVSRGLWSDHTTNLGAPRRYTYQSGHRPTRRPVPPVLSDYSEIQSGTARGSRIQRGCWLGIEWRQVPLGLHEPQFPCFCQYQNSLAPFHQTICLSESSGPFLVHPHKQTYYRVYGEVGRMGSLSVAWSGMKRAQ